MALSGLFAGAGKKSLAMSGVSLSQLRQPVRLAPLRWGSEAPGVS